MADAPRIHRLTLRDAWALHVREVGPEDGARGVVVAGHAMMVDGRTLLRGDRPCLARALADAGYRVLVPDLRGHGRSGPRAGAGGDWTYDDLVADVGELIDFARAIAPGRPLVLLGHSLFAHVALAYLGLRPCAPVVALVMVGADVWLPEAEPSRAVWALKRALLAASGAVVRGLGRLPARALRLGTDDEASGYWRSFDRLPAEGWRGLDGRDYGWASTRVACPVLHVVSEGDRLLARPASARALSARVPRRELWHLGRTGEPDLDRAPPGHMALVTDPASAPLWHAVARWLDRHVGSGAGALPTQVASP